MTKHYMRDRSGYSACGRSIPNSRAQTTEPREATCKACIKSAEMMGER